MECKKSPRAAGKEKSCSTAGKMRPWGLHAHKFNCAAGALCRGIIEGVDGPDPVLQSSFGKRVGEWLHSLGFAADDCSEEKEDIIECNNHQLRQDKAKLIGNMGSLEADCVELKVGCCQGSRNVRQWVGGSVLWCWVWCSARWLCPVEAGAVKLPAKSCFNGHQKFTAKPTRRASSRMHLGALLWLRVCAPVHGCAAILAHPAAPENGHQDESQMPRAPFPCSLFQVIAFPCAVWR